ncbi:glycosyltransferase family 2 protein [Cecembia calidifontis]|jgi:cellulose synthase/poly-beta-1,6-N-acetylglucosamine synthase-like glycosyltransferase|uniref:Cellulose synthase/poly-beta-1,6-N-acetylglucosamine synthase-like glycosyltransferase n=1 Tax=Cecembia calidifontis TaxID=1187080 RepID=A0A4V2F6Z8_9BACT|nr:glycosyltransferase [Cecembia calidifontis]RZS98069.1 cellulose synthase/poly-beta-1,6-N-acetylglucosamine synthase-like glycosyltransferase [Cecembia calidifontis]
MIIEDILKNFEGFVIVYASIYILIFILMAFVSFFAIKIYNNAKYTIKDDVLVNSNDMVGVSIVAPAFNEELNIVYNVKSLLSLNYPNYEVVIVNDGSTDSTLQKLIDEFELVKVNFFYEEKIKTKPVRAHYKSTNPIYSKLLVVDKENGKSKADASNAGINSSKFPLFLCTDVDCILRNDTILKLAKLFMGNKERVIAAGAAIRASNSCEVKDGFLVKIHYPKNWWASFQEIEYVRSFLLGRMAWSQVNGLLLVSGGLGMFDKEIAIEAGGYWAKSLGEDIELITRMRKVMSRRKEKFRIVYIPESLCWTEVPASLKSFWRQRVRWGRGLAQTLFIHRSMIFNPKYGVTGLVLLPYYLIFEFLVPIIELLGLIGIVLGFIFLEISFLGVFKMVFLVYCFYLQITILSVLWDQWIYGHYSNLKEMLHLLIKAILEPFIYHPFSLFASLKGYLNFLLKKEHKWGVMLRQGFTR